VLYVQHIARRTAEKKATLAAVPFWVRLGHLHPQSSFCPVFRKARAPKKWGQTFFNFLRFSVTFILEAPITKKPARQ
jgi:hypothetical protein